MADTNGDQQKPNQAVAIKKDFFHKLSTELSNRKGQVQQLLPKYLNAERLFMVAYQAVARTPALQECTIESILKCVIQGAELGLEVGGPMGHGYFVPFKNKHTGRKEAQFIPGYRGLNHLALKAGAVQKIEARTVYEKDQFDVEYGTEPRLTHKPAAGERGNPIAYYAVARLTNGDSQFEVMSQAEVNKIKARSRARDDGPWVTDPEEMGKKTVSRRLHKWLPMTDGKDMDRLAKAIELDNEATGLEEGAVEASSTFVSDMMPSDIAEKMEAEKAQNGEQATSQAAADDPDDPANTFDEATAPLNESRLKVITETIAKRKLDQFQIAALLQPYGVDSADKLTNANFEDCLRRVIEMPEPKKGKAVEKKAEAREPGAEG